MHKLLLYAGHHTLQQKITMSSRMTETSSAPFQTLITFSLTRSLLHHQLCGPRVLFRTINLVLFALVKITHPDTCWEGLMTVPVERLLLPTRSDSFSFMCSFLFSLHLLYWLTSRPLPSSSHTYGFKLKLFLFPAVLSIFWHFCTSTRIIHDGRVKNAFLSLSPSFSSSIRSISLSNSFSFSFSLSPSW